MAGESVNPGGGIREADPILTSGAIRYGSGDWVRPPSDGWSDYYKRTNLSTGDGNSGLHASHSPNSLTVSVFDGEGFVGGSWFGKEYSDEVVLDANTANQTVYIGWKTETSNTVVVGLDSAFRADWPKMAIWEFDTDGNGVSNKRDLRNLGEQIDVRNEGSVAQADHANTADDAGHAFAAEHTQNAYHLGGVAPSGYARRSQDETITGRYDFSDGAVLGKSQANWITLNQLHALPGGSNAIVAKDPIEVTGSVSASKGGDFGGTTTVQHLQVNSNIEMRSDIHLHGNDAVGVGRVDVGPIRMQDAWIGEGFNDSIWYEGSRWVVKDQLDVTQGLDVRGKIEAGSFSAGQLATVGEASTRIGYPTGNGFIIGPTNAANDPTLEPVIAGNNKRGQQLRFDKDTAGWVFEGGLSLGHALHMTRQVQHGDAPPDSLYRGPDNELWYKHKGGRSKLS